jgi:hypothetical protein
MKKHVRQFAIVLLVISMMVCIIALPASATEVAPCTAICDHPYYMVTDYEECINTGGGTHTVIPYKSYTCAKCGYGYDTPVGNRYTEPCVFYQGRCIGCRALEIG